MMTYVHNLFEGAIDGHMPKLHGNAESTIEAVVFRVDYRGDRLSRRSSIESTIESILYRGDRLSFIDYREGQRLSVEEQAVAQTLPSIPRIPRLPQDGCPSAPMCAHLDGGPRHGVGKCSSSNAREGAPCA